MANDQIEKEVEKPIYFLSDKLNDMQTRWSTMKKEPIFIVQRSLSLLIINL